MYNVYGSPLLTNVTFSGNTAGNRGGGMGNFESSPILTNVTFNNNSAGRWGGGLRNEYHSHASLVNVTFSGNSAGDSGGGMSAYAASQPVLVNVLIANSTGGDCATDDSLGAGSNHNLIEDATSSCGMTDGVDGNVVGLDPSLSALDLHRGLVPTMLLLHGSPAIDAGSNSDCPVTDAQGVPRPAGAACDIGAVEAVDTLILYARPSAVGLGDCLSWGSACTLAGALDAAVSGDEVWVQAGTHYPDSVNGFVLPDGVGIYGGFLGDETARSQRDWQSHATFLTYLGGYGAIEPYHMVVGSGTGAGTVLDGFTITGNITPNSHSACGAGLYNDGGSPTLANLVFEYNEADRGGAICNLNHSNPSLTNIIFDHNAATTLGGAIYNQNSDPTLTDVTIQICWSLTDGGGIYNDHSSPVLTDVMIQNSQSVHDGGGMYNTDSNPVLTRVTFSQNYSSNYGGGIFDTNSRPVLTDVTFDSNGAENGGGIYNEAGSDAVLENVTFSLNNGTNGAAMYNDHSRPVLTNATFSGNIASLGAGMYNTNDSDPTLVNVTFSGGFASTSGGGLYNEGSSSPLLTNVLIANILYGGDCDQADGSLDPASTHNLIEDETHACGLIDGVSGNILGVDPNLAGLNDNGGETLTLALLSGSPAINTGTNLGCPGTDQRGQSRPLGGQCDIGAFEYAAPTRPAVTTDAATNLTATTATLNGSVNAHGADATVTFEYGLTTAYGTSAIFAGNPVTGAADLPVDAAIGGLAPGTTYHFRVVGTNSAGTTYGADLTFTTLASAGVTITTDIHDAAHNPITFAALGDSLHARATVTGNDTPAATGSVTFSAYANPSCSGTGSNAGTLSLAAGGEAEPSLGVVLTEDGLSFRARYGGDANYPATDGPCVPISTSQYPTVLTLSAQTIPSDGALLTTRTSRLFVQFDRGVLHGAPANPDSADHPANYLLVEAGADGMFETLACGPAGTGGPQPDDVQIAVNSVSYNAATFVARLNVNGGRTLPNGVYRLFVCGTTSIVDAAGTTYLNNRTADSVVTFSVALGPAAGGASGKKGKLPDTGFAPGVVTRLPAQAVAYTHSDLWLEIPRLGVQMDIVGIPQSADGTWDVSWLGGNAGWLNGTTYPTWNGNSVLTGHVFDSNGKAGPFRYINTLWYGDRIIIHTGGAQYIYEVRSVSQVEPGSLTQALKHEELPWLTLVTCRGYDEKTNSYHWRIIVRAVQVSIK
jgi:LPXTG-site transpeptidase (sortase) family protein